MWAVAGTAIRSGVCQTSRNATGVQLDNPTLLGIAAVVSALGGLGSLVMALRKSHDEEHQLCLERLKEVRAESEKLAKELHELRMSDAP